MTEKRLVDICSIYSVPILIRMSEERLNELLKKYPDDVSGREPDSAIVPKTHMEYYMPTETDRLFLIENQSERVLFPEEFNAKEYHMIIERITSSAALIELMQLDSTYAKMDIFRQMPEFRKKAEEKIDRIAAGKDRLSPEDASDHFTTEFIKFLRDSVIKIFENCRENILRMNNAEHYRQAASLLTSYLRECCFYNLPILLNFGDNKPVFKNVEKTVVTEEWINQIIRINSFPYYLDYYDDNGERINTYIKGSCSIGVKK